MFVNPQVLNPTGTFTNESEVESVAQSGGLNTSLYPPSGDAILVAATTNVSVEVFLLNPTTLSVEFHQPLAIPGANQGGPLLALGDVNGDGLPDIVVGLNGTHIFLSARTSNQDLSYPGYSLLSPSTPVSIAVGDVDGVDPVTARASVGGKVPGLYVT